MRLSDFIKFSFCIHATSTVREIQKDFDLTVILSRLHNWHETVYVHLFKKKRDRCLMRWDCLKIFLFLYFFKNLLLK